MMIQSFISNMLFGGGSSSGGNGNDATTATNGGATSMKANFGGTVNSSTSNNDPITKKETDRGSIFQAGITYYAFSGMQGWRVTMEDAHVVCPALPVFGEPEPLIGHSLFAVLDGHGGDYTSMYGAKHLISTLSRVAAMKAYYALPVEDQRDVPGIELLRSALTEVFGTLDAKIRRQQNLRNDAFLVLSEQQQQRNESNSNNNNNTNLANLLNAQPPPPPPIRFERSGSTCVVVLVTPSHIICANAGDSRAILRRNGQTLPLSFDHKPPNIPELERIQQAGGFVKGRRVDGDLAVSRGLGDFLYKSNETKPVGQQKVIPDPEILIYPRSLSGDEFIVLACDGVWDVASNAQCSDFISELVHEGESDLGLICEEALDVCLARNSRDNMTLGLIGFTGMSLATGLSKRNVVWQRRATRQAKAFEIQARLAATRAAMNVGLFIPQPKGKKSAQVLQPKRKV